MLDADSGDSSSSSSMPLILPSELMSDNMFEDEQETETDALMHPHRRNQKAETLEEKVCKFFLRLNTTSAPRNAEEYDMYNGVVFRLRTKNVGLEINTLELDLKDFESTEVRVFTKVGEFNRTDIFADPSTWEQVTTDTAFALATAERKNTIIPYEQFHPITMEPKESRLIYVALPSDTPLLKSATNAMNFDEVYARNNELVTHVGFAVTGSEYFGTTIEDRPFHGIIHYETKLPCEDQRESLTMMLPYFVDQQDPATIVVSLARNAINQAVKHAMSRDAKLIRMQNIGGLRFQEASTDIIKDETFSGR